MSANTCPVCGKDVMPYRRFIREAEPWKISLCGSCNTKLKRSPTVYLHIGMMCLIIVLIGFPLFAAMVKEHYSFSIIWSVVIVLLICWVLLTNYLSWRYIGWVVIRDKEK